jgi:hypothetical protein
MRSEEKSYSKDKFFITVIIIGGLFFFFSQNKSGKISSVMPGEDIRQEQINLKVSSEIAFAEKAQQFHETAEKSRQSMELSSLHPRPQLPPQKPATQLDLQSDRNEMNAFNDLNRYPKVVDYSKPSHVIQNQITAQIDEMKARNAYQAAYMKRFIENARAQGYEVQLGSNNEVISVRPLRNPNSLPGPSNTSSQFAPVK